MDQLSSQNIHSKCKSPKFLRRSVSPVDYMSSSEFRAREKRRDIHVDFGYVTEKKLGKISIKKRESMCGRSESKQTNDQRHSQKSQPSTNLENSFVKTNNDMSTSNFQRSVGQYGSDPTIDSDILKSLEEDSEVLKAQINLHEQLCNARKKIFELQSEVESKNRIIQEQSKQIRGLQSKIQETSCKAQKFRVEAETSNIKLRMEMRKSCDFLTQIKKLKADNIRKRNILQRVHIRQQSAQYNRYSEYAVDVFELSPDKSQD